MCDAGLSGEQRSALSGIAGALGMPSLALASATIFKKSSSSGGTWKIPRLVRSSASSLAIIFPFSRSSFFFFLERHCHISGHMWSGLVVSFILVNLPATQ